MSNVTDLKRELPKQDLMALPILTAIPAKPKIGKIYYFGNAILPNITVEGFWGYKSTGWVLLG